MTNLELSESYANLLILEYIGQPNAYAYISLIALIGILNQLPSAVLNAYDIGSAVGPQLDVIGKYVGASRSGYGPSGPITLVDSDFRLLIQLAVVKNNSGSSLGTIQSELHSYFGNSILISDSADMQINYSIVNTFGTSALQSIILYNDILPRPMGVTASVSIITPIAGNFFCFSTYSANAPTGTAPFNDYNFYHPTYIWIGY